MVVRIGGWRHEKRAVDDGQEVTGIEQTVTASQCWAAIAPDNMYHLDTKPTAGGSPIIDSAAMAKAPMVQGMRRPMPSSWLTSVLCAAV